MTVSVSGDGGASASDDRSKPQREGGGEDTQPSGDFLLPAATAAEENSPQEPAPVSVFPQRVPGKLRLHVTWTGGGCSIFRP